MRLKPSEFPTEVIPNLRTRGNSGTGAWNTGIHRAFLQSSEGFVSILDDDDEYIPNHLADCLEYVLSETNVIAIFQRLVWNNTDGSFWYFPLTQEKLTPQHFFIGNPGVQGSNMFFKTQSLIDIGGFDETFPNTTDRELMIRFLRYAKRFKDKEIKVLENYGVIHYNHMEPKVNNDLLRKHEGLKLFYRKYKNDFSPEDFQLSLERAEKLFHFKYQDD